MYKIISHHTLTGIHWADVVSTELLDMHRVGNLSHQKYSQSLMVIIKYYTGTRSIAEFTKAKTSIDKILANPI